MIPGITLGTIHPGIMAPHGAGDGTGDGVVSIPDGIAPGIILPGMDTTGVAITEVIMVDTMADGDIIMADITVTTITTVTIIATDAHMEDENLIHFLPVTG